MITKTEHFKTHLVSSVLIESDKVLLSLRHQTKMYPGFWSLPTGHIELCEEPKDALVRECSEELGIQIEEAKLLTYKIDKDESIVNYVYQIISYQGKILNQEPHLCRQLGWFSLDNLPKPLTPVSQSILLELN